MQDLVQAALRRSTSFEQVVYLEGETVKSHRNHFIVAINPDSEVTDLILDYMNSNSRLKLIILGSLTNELINILGLEKKCWPGRIYNDAKSQQATKGSYRESIASIKYSNLAVKLGGQAWERPQSVLILQMSGITWIWCC